MNTKVKQKVVIPALAESTPAPLAFRSIQSVLPTHDGYVIVWCTDGTIFAVSPGAVSGAFVWTELTPPPLLPAI